MAYSARLTKLLKKAGASAGSPLNLVLSDGRRLDGLLMPRIEMGSPQALVVKLSSGYNVGIHESKIASLKRTVPTGLAGELGKVQSVPQRRQEGLPEISLVATGGTISARVDYRLGAVAAKTLTPQEILSVIPELSGVVNFRSVLSPFRLASEDMTCKEWARIASAVASELNKGAAGAVVTHGTDTLAFTAAALSFMLPNLCKPVAVVGAQRSPDRGSFDGALNMVAASRYAGYSDIAEVAVVMHENSSDRSCIAIRGTKARKMHSTRRDAFRPINDSPLARILADGSIQELQEHRRRGEGKVIADTKFDQRVGILKAYPGSQPGLLDCMVDAGTRGIVIEATALGHVPLHTANPRLSWGKAILRALDKGVAVGVATQCIYGPVQPYVYTPLRELSEMGVFFCGDMLPEVAYIKLGFLLGHGLKGDELKARMVQNIAGELNPRITHEQFLN